LAARTRILAPCFALLALALTGCVPAFGGGVDIDACANDVVDGFRNSLPPELAANVSATEVEEAARPVCAELDTYLEQRDGGEPVTREEQLRFATELVRERPDLYQPLCRATLRAEIESLGEVGRFVTTKEKARYETQVCRLAPHYLMPGTLKADQDRLAMDSPELYAPFCAAGIQDELAGDPLATSLGQRTLGVVARSACVEGYRRGVISCECAGRATDPEAFAQIWDKHVRRALAR
jgi:hypothetical protein